jgi:hypothetical protein
VNGKISTIHERQLSGEQVGTVRDLLGHSPVAVSLRLVHLVAIN